MLLRNEVTEGIVGQYVDIYHFADGQVDVRWKGLSLPYTVFDKEQRVSQAAVVENKRLGAALAFVKARQDAPRPSPRVKSASEAGGYVKRGRKPRRISWLTDEATQTAAAMVPPTPRRATGPAVHARLIGPRLRRPAPQRWALTPASIQRRGRCKRLRRTSLPASSGPWSTRIGHFYFGQPRTFLSGCNIAQHGLIST